MEAAMASTQKRASAATRVVVSASVEDFLQQFRSEEVLYIPNPGNAGDSVIATATYQTFRRLGLRYALPRMSRLDVSGRVVIYGGGGNLVKESTYAARIAQLLHARVRRLVILPHTVKSVTPLLEAFGTNVDLICRESVSYEYAASTGTRANLHLMDDMAFRLDVDDAMRPRSDLSAARRLVGYGLVKAFSTSAVPSINDVVRAARLSQIREEIKDRVEADELYCFRTDGEKTDIPLPPLNIDLSEVFRFGVETEDAAYLSSGETLRFLSKFKTVHTNRLHMAISSALLGLDVRFYANDYYKCRAVYEHSMKNRFSNVQWMK